MTKKIKVTESLGDVHNYSLLGMHLWLTPGSTCPYWASQASFMYDEIVATPYDFLDELGYSSFEEEPDYEEWNPEATIEIETIPYMGN